jgi:MerR family mercuric resistance operon transcriptional regulator
VNSGQTKLTRGVLAARAGVNAETIRYYEKIALMPEPGRNAAGHRSYLDIHLQRLCFIRRCREMGFTLEEIRELLSLVDKEQVTCDRVQQIANAQVSRIKGKIEDLQRMQRTLVALSSQCSGEDVPECPIIEALLQC